ncbi:MAG: hypothetical protein ACKVZ0_06330 [Gemmatimonadales bacterium]
MIELTDNQLVFRFPEVHEDATLTIEFQRTLRIPDDDREYPLPAGLGAFPLRHVDDFAATVPGSWIEHGGILLPMHQAEAMWLRFEGSYPFAVKVAAGKINAVTGEPWRGGLHRDPQDYLVRPGQPWLDGYCVEKGVIRQFVAMPLGEGYTAEEQITGRAEFGGLQIAAYPMKPELYERAVVLSRSVFECGLVAGTFAMFSPAMGLAPGGRMKQEIFEDHYALSDWDQRHAARCFIHLANAAQWRTITGEDPPATPVDAAAYRRAGIPWFDYYAPDLRAVAGSGILNRLKSLGQIARGKRDAGVPANDPVIIDRVVRLRRNLERSQVRESEL